MSCCELAGEPAVRISLHADSCMVQPQPIFCRRSIDRMPLRSVHPRYAVFLYYKYSMVTVKLLDDYMQIHPKSLVFFYFCLTASALHGRLLCNHGINLKENVPRTLRAWGTWPRAFPNSARCPPAALMRAVEQRARADGPSARKRASAPQLSSRPRYGKIIIKNK